MDHEKKFTTIRPNLGQFIDDNSLVIFQCIKENQTTIFNANGISSGTFKWHFSPIRTVFRIVFRNIFRN